jgi:hypothetical protein
MEETNYTSQYEDIDEDYNKGMMEYIERTNDPKFVAIKFNYKLSINLSRSVQTINDIVKEKSIFNNPLLGLETNLVACPVKGALSNNSYHKNKTIDRVTQTPVNPRKGHRG